MLGILTRRYYSDVCLVSNELRLKDQVITKKTGLKNNLIQIMMQLWPLFHQIFVESDKNSLELSSSNLSNM